VSRGWPTSPFVDRLTGDSGRAQQGDASFQLAGNGCPRRLGSASRSRIAPTTLALCERGSIGLKYRKRPGEKARLREAGGRLAFAAGTTRAGRRSVGASTDGVRGACGEHARASPGGKRRERAPALHEGEPSCHEHSFTPAGLIYDSLRPYAGGLTGKSLGVQGRESPTNKVGVIRGAAGELANLGNSFLGIHRLEPLFDGRDQVFFRQSAPPPAVCEPYRLFVARVRINIVMK